VEFSVEDQRPISYLEISVQISRRSGYYLFHVFSLVYLTDVLCWCIFFVDPGNLAARLSLVITLFLALAALNFVVAGFIPRVSHDTYLMQYFVVSYVCIVFTGLQSVLSSMLNTFYCGVTTGNAPCDTTVNFDWITAAVIAVGETAYSAFFLPTCASEHGKGTRPLIPLQTPMPQSPSNYCNPFREKTPGLNFVIT